MLTSCPKPDEAKRARELGVSGVLLKPIRPAALLDAILRSLVRPEAGRRRCENPAPGTQPQAASEPQAGAEPQAGSEPQAGAEPVHHPTDAGTSGQRTGMLHPTGDTTAPRLRILVVDDNAVNQRVAEALLEKAGHEVVLAANGIEAIERWEASPFQVVLMDVQMPEMDGVEATQEIRRRETAKGGHTPIIAMTALVMAGDRERLLSQGMDAYLSKPFRRAQLLSVIDETLRAAA
jgi:CheY-like chemotaxis protein